MPSRSSIYGTLVRRHRITRKRPRSDYKRWERPGPMQLWQLDINFMPVASADRDAA